jgi:hypothetical protein
MNASFGQFARGFAGVDYLTPLSPAFTAFSMPLVPAVGTPRRAASSNNIVLTPAGAELAEAQGAGAGAGASTPRGRHRPQRSLSAGELSRIVVVAPVEPVGPVAEGAAAGAAAGTAGPVGGPQDGWSLPCPQHSPGRSPDHRNQQPPGYHELPTKALALEPQHASSTPASSPAGTRPLAGSAPASGTVELEVGDPGHS